MIKALAFLISHDTETGKYFVRWDATGFNETTVTFTRKGVMTNMVNKLLAARL